MARPTNREEFKKYCLRDLGAPVIKINVDDDQVDDRIDDALDMFQNFHFDAIEKIYLKHVITPGDVANTYVTMPENVISVSRIFKVGDGGGSSQSMFDIGYQWKLNDMPTLTSPFLVDYYLMKRHLVLLDQMFSGEIGIRHTRHQRRVYVDFDWSVDAPVGQYLIFDANAIIDENTYTKIWNDSWLKRYATQLIKRQWGANLKKFSGIPLPGSGGVTFSGQQLYDEAEAKIKELELEVREVWQEPPHFIVG